ncbi:hypothetical protein QBC43DRAFT_321104, partial [Cladorrhinum sp. PSN259]
FYHLHKILCAIFFSLASSEEAIHPGRRISSISFKKLIERKSYNYFPFIFIFFIVTKAGRWRLRFPGKFERQERRFYCNPNTIDLRHCGVLI